MLYENIRAGKSFANLKFPDYRIAGEIHRQEIDPRSAGARPVIGVARRRLLPPPLTRLCPGSFFDPPGRQGAARLLDITA